MITLDEFLQLAMDDYYKINIFYNETGKEIIHQKEVGEIEEALEEMNLQELLYHTIGSWDIVEEKEPREFTINID